MNRETGNCDDVVRFIRASVKKAEQPWLTGAISVDILDGRLRATPFYWLATPG